MLSLYLGDDGDLALDGQGNLRMVEGPDEAVQVMRILFLTHVEEWFLNLYHGTDYRRILGRKPRAHEEQMREAVMAAMAQEPRVEDVLSLEFEYDPQTRGLTISWEAVMDGEAVMDTVEVG